MGANTGSEPLMVHQNKKTNFGSSFYLSKTEGLGMASIRIANCMELRLVRVWHQAIACISPSSVLIPCSPLARFHAATSCGFNTMLRIDLVRKTENRLKQGFSLAFSLSEATPTCIKTSTRLGAKIGILVVYCLICELYLKYLIKHDIIIVRHS